MKETNPCPICGLPRDPDGLCSDCVEGAPQYRMLEVGEVKRPKIVCLCGSSKFPTAHMRAMMTETLAGRIVIPMGLYGHADFPPGARAATNDGDESTEVKQVLDRLHFAKIDVADEILVVSVGEYIGSSTKREIGHAMATGKQVRYHDDTTPSASGQPAQGTPRTDAESRRVYDDEKNFEESYDVAVAAWSFARSLETELAEKDAEIARQTRDYRASIAKSDEGKNQLAGTIRQLREEVARLTKERNAFVQLGYKLVPCIDGTHGAYVRLQMLATQRDAATARAERLATAAQALVARIKAEGGKGYKVHDLSDALAAALEETK